MYYHLLGMGKRELLKIHRAMYQRSEVLRKWRI